MSVVRIFQIAKELNISHTDILSFLNKKGVDVKSHMSPVDEEVKTLNCKKHSKRGCHNKSTKCITHNLWDELDQHINGFFEKVKLQDITKSD